MTGLCEPLAALDGSDLSARFVYWRGASGQRYLHTVYPLDAVAGIAASVVLLVRHEETGPRVLGVVVSENGDADDLALVLALGRELRADEMHVHALAAGKAELRAAAQDLTQAAARLWARRDAPKMLRRNSRSA